MILGVPAFTASLPILEKVEADNEETEELGEDRGLRNGDPGQDRDSLDFLNL